MEEVSIVNPPFVQLGESMLQKKTKQKTTAVKKAASATKSGKAWKKPADKPRHPLTAYNLFYQFERANILEGADQPKPTHLNHIMHLGVQCASKKRIAGQKVKIGSVEDSRRIKISLAELTKMIALRWKSLDAATKGIFEKRAVIERERYQLETAQWQMRIQRMIPTNSSLPEDSSVSTLPSRISHTFPHQESMAESYFPSSLTGDTAEQWHHDVKMAHCYQSQNVDKGLINQYKEMGNNSSFSNNFSAQKGLVLHPAFHKLDQGLDQSMIQGITNKGNEKLLLDLIRATNPLREPTKASSGCGCQGCQTKTIIDFNKVGQNEIKDLDTSQASTSYQSARHGLLDANDTGKLVHPIWDELPSINCNISMVSHNDNIINHKIINPTCIQPHKPVFGDTLTLGNNFPVSKEHFLTTSNYKGANDQKEAMHKVLEYHIQEMQRLSEQLCLLESDKQNSSALEGVPHDPTGIGMNRVPYHGNVHEQDQSFATPMFLATNPSQVQAAGAQCHCPHSTVTKSENVLFDSIPNSLYSLFQQRTQISHQQPHVVDTNLPPFYQHGHHSDEALHHQHEPMTWVSKDPVCQDMNWFSHQEE